MMRQDVISRRHIDDAGARLKAFSDDPRLDLIRPPPFATLTRLDNLATPNAANLLAGASMAGTPQINGLETPHTSIHNAPQQRNKAPHGVVPRRVAIGAPVAPPPFLGEHRQAAVGDHDTARQARHLSLMRHFPPAVGDTLRLQALSNG